MSYLWDDYNKGKARDAAKQMALESTAQEFQKNLSTYIARAQNACLNLEEKYSWKRGEVGFDTRNDAPELLKIRPRDPYLLKNIAIEQSKSDQCTSPDLFRLSNECLKAASYVPSNRIYDEYRGWLIYDAGSIADRALSKEIEDNPRETAYTTAAHVVGIWDACLKFIPIDQSGEIGERRAVALMQSGHYQDALTQADSVASLR